MNINIKRIYDPSSKNDGIRILVDRLWPRGIKKEAADIDKWMAAVAPSKELRKWYNHEPDKFDAFSEKYKTELSQTNALDELLDYIDHHETITLLFGAKDEQFNNAVVLRKIIIAHFKK